MSYQILLNIQTLCCALLTGLIWVIQLVHYPSFAYVEPTRFKRFEMFHAVRISLIVIPLMVLELLSAILIFGYEQAEPGLLILADTALILIWLSTLCLSVPAHYKLSKGWNEKAFTWLVKSNWPRTILWSLRLVILSFLCLRW